jgi:hypothetical protein
MQYSVTYPSFSAGYISTAPSSTFNSTLENKTATPSESQQTITPTSNNYYLESVTVEAIPSSYVGSEVTRRSSTDLSASGATVTAPAGYYAEAASKSVASGSATGPSSLSGSSATISTGTNTITLTKTGVSTTPTVSAGYVSSATSSSATVALTASVTTKAAATITPGTTNQTIASGTYLTGTQTISGDADLTAANIKQGVQIFNVTGSYTSDATAAAEDIVSGETAYVNGSKITGNLIINKYYTGTSAPSNSFGNNHSFLGDKIKPDIKNSYIKEDSNDLELQIKDSLKKISEQYTINQYENNNSRFNYYCTPFLYRNYDKNNYNCVNNNQETNIIGNNL